ncbi:MAG TPA: DUF885 domain-containing protein [Gammaproteobacteria bacterium]|jgi:uncharacterized protein (DUF885 family)|nr:DUF885 domain-containing protein [Gammaproteobacteria bacterium]
MKKLPALSLLLFAALSFAPLGHAADNAATQALHQLFQSSWDRGMRENPLYASDLGDRRYNDQWGDTSLAALKRYHAEDQADYQALLKIDRAQLSPQDKVSYDLFKWQHEDGEESWKFHEYLFPLNQLGGIQTVGDYAQSLRFTTLKDYQDWLKRLQTFAPYMDQTIALLQQGVDQGYTLPKVVADRIPQQIEANIVSDPTKSVFYLPFKNIPDSIDAATAKQLQADARKAIADVIVPAFKRLDVFFTKTYVPHARTSLAASSLPDGKAYYAYLVRHFTTTDMTPEQVHELGLKKVAEIHQQMLDIIRQVKFKGSFADFLHYLRTDPKFYYKNPADLLEAYKAQAKTIDPLLVTEFHKLPRIPWGIKVIPADQAPNTYPAYSYPPAADGSRAAYMYVNLYKPETRPKYEIPVLTCHEGRPGHALQLSLATELTGLPNFRRFGYYNAYGEGWALYTEVLCGEMGVYDTPYKQFGALSYQSWRAVRLVVDTGIHYFGWTRKQAVDYMKANTALTDQNINTEVDRYIAWPGQALSYMIGELTILKLRDEAKQKLGDKFDIKAFNDEILSNGTLPMSVLEKEVREWMEQQVKENKKT